MFHVSNIQLHIMKRVYKRIIVQYTPNAMSNVQIYDGPGPLSPEVFGNQVNSYQIILSGYQGYIKYTIDATENLLAEYKAATKFSFINPRLLS